MQKFILYILTLFFITSLTYSQTLSWCTPGASWSIRQDYIPYYPGNPPGSPHYHEFKYFGDTFINGDIYQIILRHYNGQPAFLHDDTIHTRIDGNKIFIRVKQMGTITEGLMVDYDWNVGDTVDIVTFFNILQDPDYDDSKWVIEKGTEMIQGVELKYVIIQYRKRIYYETGSIPDYYDTLVVQKFNERIGPWDNRILWVQDWGNIDDFASSYLLKCYSDNQINLNFNTTGYSCLDNLSDIYLEPENGNILYPNPANNYTTFSLQIAPPLGTSLQLTDMNGRELRSFKVIGKSTELDLSNLSNGMYFVNYRLKENTIWKGKICVLNEK